MSSVEWMRSERDSQQRESNARSYSRPLLFGPPAGHHRDMTKYLISFPSEAMVLTDDEFPIVSADGSVS